MAMNVLANNGGGFTPPTDNLANLTEVQIYSLSRRILARSIEKVQDMFTPAVENGDTKHVPTGQAVYDAIRNESTKISAELSAKATEYTDERVDYISNVVNAISNWKYETIDGELPRNPDPTTIYLQRDDEYDKTYVMYVFSKGRWIAIGDTTLDLINYWKKDDVEALTEALVHSPDFLSKLFTAGNSKEVVVKADPGSTVVATLPDGTLVSGVADASGNATLTLPNNGDVDLNYKLNGVIVNGELSVIDGNSPYKLTVDPGTRVTASMEDGTIVTAVADAKGRVELEFPKDGTWTLTTTENGVDNTRVVSVEGKGSLTNYDNRYVKLEDIDEILSMVDQSENYLDRTDKDTYVDFFGLLSDSNGTSLASTGLTNQDAEDIKATARTAIRDLGFLKIQELADLLNITTPTPNALTNTLVQAAILKIVNNSGVVANLTASDIADLRQRLQIDELSDTYLTIQDFKSALGMSTITPVNSTTVSNAVMNVVNENQDKITYMSDTRFNDLLSAKFSAVD